MLDPVRWICDDGRILDGPTDAVLLPGKLRLIDQTRLPGELVYLETADLAEIVDSIKRLVVRGAPAIGCAAALGLAAVAQHSQAVEREKFLAEVSSSAASLAASRPTAVNLFWALERCRNRLAGSDLDSVAELKQLLIREALDILAEDIEMCRSIGRHGSVLIEDGFGVLTHCNAGALATSDYGTALSPMYTAFENGVDFRVFADETRPLLQGARLTAWELDRAGIEVVAICDNMAAQVMKEGRINLVVVGADRIAANGDAANKIGTYGVAVLADYHHIPFYVAAPYSTIDVSLADGSMIPIEQRDGDEIRCGFGRRTVPESVAVYNPAFDVTPNALIAGIITEKGVLKPPFTESIQAFLRKN